MKKQLFSFLFLVSLVLSSSAQTAELSQTQKSLRKHVSYLASDQLEGRRTGEKGATFAAGYVANIFARYKLKGGVIKIDHGEPHPGFLQAFPYIAGVEINPESALKITDSRQLSEPDLKKDWAPLKSSPNVNLPYTSVAFVGYGITSEKLKYNDFKGLDVNGKIVLAFDGYPDAGNPHSPFGFYGVHAKAKIASEKGAKALILISRAGNFSDDKLNDSYNPTLGETSIPTMVISLRLAAKLLDVSPMGMNKLQEFAEAIGRGTLGVGSAKLETKRPLAVSLKIDLAKKNVDGYNVIGVLEGNDPVLKKEIIVIGAHYDHLGRGGRSSLAPNSKEIHHGADDNASGTSALLELARRFSKARNNKRTLMFMAFGGEEEGLLGSKYFVNNPTVPISNIVAMVNMDMIGRLKNGKLTVGGIDTAVRWKKVVTETRPYPFGETLVGSAADRAVKRGTHTPVSVAVRGNVMAAKSPNSEVFELQLSQDGFGPSDHASFYGKKIPVLFFFTGTHADYHKPTDTPEKINYYGLERITGFVEQIVKVVDRNRLRPKYTVAKSSAPSGGRRRFNVSLGTIPSYADSDGSGLVLDGVRKDSAAEKAGIKGGDKIIKLGGKEIRNISDYMFMLSEMKPDKEYEVVVMRGAEKLTLKITPKKR